MDHHRSVRDDGGVFGRRPTDDGIPGLSGSSETGSLPGIPGTMGDAPTEALPVTRDGAEAAAAAAAPPATAGTPWQVGPWTIRLFVVLFIAAYAVLFTREEQARLDDPVRQAARGEISSTSSGSLLRETSMRRALSALRTQLPAGGRVESLRLSPTRIDATLSAPDGALTIVSLDPSLTATTVRAGVQQPVGVPLSSIDPSLPTTLLRRAERKLSLKPKDLDYLLLSTARGFDGKRQDRWGLYYSRPLTRNDAAAAFDGTDVRFLGTPDKATRDAIRRAQELAAQARAGAGGAR